MAHEDVPASLKDTLKTLGFLDETEAEALVRTVEKGGTWSDGLSSFGLSDASIDEVVELIEGEQVTPEVEGRYTELAELGMGGMGRVTRVQDQHLRRQVALKTLRVQRASLRMRFLREARITGQLQHPGIVPVYEIGEREDGQLYYTMKEIEGRTLKQALAEAHTLPERLGLLDEFLDLCQAMAYAHSRSVVHRDLKPDNVMLGAFGETLVVDWGLAKHVGQLDVPSAADDTLEDNSSLTRMGTVMGTPRYMSPEQARGEAVDVRTDVWSLGVMLVELLTGEPVFTGNSETVLSSVRTGRVPDPREVVPEVPSELAAICARATQAERRDRYRTAGELAQDLEAWHAGAMVSAHDYSSAELMGRTLRRYQRELVVLAAVLVALVGSAAFFIPRLMAQRDGAERQAELMSAQSLEASGFPAASYAIARRLADEDAVAAVMADRLSWEGADAVVHRSEGSEVKHMAWSPAATRLAWVEGRRVVIADPDSGQRLREYTAPSPVTALAFDASLLWVAQEDGDLVRVPPTGPTKAFAVGHAYDLVPSPRGKRLAVQLRDQVVIWEEGQTRASVPSARPWLDTKAGPDLVQVSSSPRNHQLRWFDEEHFGIAEGDHVRLLDMTGEDLGWLTAHAAVLAWDTARLPNPDANTEALLAQAAARGWLPKREDERLGAGVLGLFEELAAFEQIDVLQEADLQRLLDLSQGWKQRADADPEASLGSAAVSEAYARLALRMAPPMEVASDETLEVFRVLVEEQMHQVLHLFADEARARAVTLVEEGLALEEGAEAPPTLRPALRILADLDPGAWVAVGTAADQLEVFHPVTGTRLAVLAAHSRDVWAVSIDAERGRAYTGGTDGRLRAWSTNETFTKADVHLQGVLSQVVAVGGDAALTLSADSSDIEEWWMLGRDHAEARRPVRRWTVGDQRITRALVSMDGERLAAATDLGQLVSWRRLPLLTRGAFGSRPTVVHPIDSPDGAWTWYRERGRVVISSTGKRPEETAVLTVPADATLSWCGLGLVVASRGLIQVYDPATGVVARRLHPTPRVEVVGGGADTLQLFVPEGEEGWTVSVGLR